MLSEPGNWKHGCGLVANAQLATRQPRTRKTRVCEETVKSSLLLLGGRAALSGSFASVSDRAGGRRILIRLAIRFRSIALVWADGGYANSVDSTLLSWAKNTLGVIIQIITRIQGTQGFQVQPRRWVVERTFGWLIRHRRLARDYEPLPTNSEAMIKIAMIQLMTARLTGTTIRWGNATEREATRRLTTERLTAA